MLHASSLLLVQRGGGGGRDLAGRARVWHAHAHVHVCALVRGHKRLEMVHGGGRAATGREEEGGGKSQCPQSYAGDSQPACVSTSRYSDVAPGR